MTWKHFLQYWSLMKSIHQWIPLIINQNFDVFFVVGLNSYRTTSQMASDLRCYDTFVSSLQCIGINGEATDSDYRQVSDIRRTKSQHLKDSRTVLRLSLPNPLKPDVESRMKM